MMTDSRDVTVPWPRPSSPYHPNGPSLEAGDATHFYVAGFEFSVLNTGETAMNTGRARYNVYCESCSENLHEATTCPRAIIEDHLGRSHNFTGSVYYAEGENMTEEKSPSGLVGLDVRTTWRCRECGTTQCTIRPLPNPASFCPSRPEGKRPASLIYPFVEPPSHWLQLCGDWYCEDCSDGHGAIWVVRCWHGKAMGHMPTLSPFAQRSVALRDAADLAERCTDPRCGKHDPLRFEQVREPADSP